MDKAIESRGEFDDGAEQFFFDDCPICQLMKRVEEERRGPLVTEIFLADEAARRLGGVSGGLLYEIWFNRESGVR
jgi:hypothetical protein